MSWDARAGVLVGNTVYDAAKVTAVPVYASVPAAYPAAPRAPPRGDSIYSKRFDPQAKTGGAIAPTIRLGPALAQEVKLCRHQPPRADAGPEDSPQNRNFH